MSYVDLMSNVRWTEADHRNRDAAILASTVPHDREHTLFRRMFSLLVIYTFPVDHPLRAKAKPLTPAQELEVYKAALAYLEADSIAETGRADSALLNSALDIEEAVRRLGAVPAPPAEGYDPYAQARTDAAAVVDALTAAASSQVLALMSTRAAWRASQEAPQKPTPK